MLCNAALSLAPAALDPPAHPQPVLVSNMFSCINSVEDRVILTSIAGDNVSDSLFDT